MQTSRRASCHLSILSSGSIYFAAPATLPVYTNCFFFPNPPVFCSALLYVVAATTREGTMRPLNSTSPFVFRLSGLLLSVFIYRTITAQFMPSIKTVLAALCAISFFFLSTVSVPLSLSAFAVISGIPGRIDGNKMLHQPSVIHANCVLSNVHATTFVYRTIFPYSPSTPVGHKEEIKPVSGRADTGATLPCGETDVGILT